jgi:broad specificity phosphatase PhoE
LSTVYLFRHGQAGTRDAYDSLSDLGRRQSRLLGEYFVSQRVQFSAVYSGAMCRQRQTAEEMRNAYIDADRAFPEIIVDAEWNEFDLGLLYQRIAPQLCAGDPQFKAEYELMRERIRASAGVDDEIHRKWQPCDSKLVQAWIRNQHPHDGETWEQFCMRIADCRARIPDAQPQDKIAVFTSATPVAIWTGLALEIFDERIMRLAGVLYNSSFTSIQLRGEQLRLFTFNAIPHLTRPELRTHR